MTEDNNNELLQFLGVCFKEFTNVLNEAGYDTADMLMSQELDQIGDYVARSFLSDEMYQSMFGQDVLQYLYIINTFCFEAGAVLGEKIAEIGADADIERIDAALMDIPNEFYSGIVEGEVVELAEQLMADSFGLMSEEEANDAIYTPLYRKWVELNQANLGLADGMNYVYVACVASFHVGVSLTRAVI